MQRRYRVSWRGPYDGQRNNDRILTLTAKNKKQALELVGRLFPMKKIRVEYLTTQKK